MRLQLKNSSDKGIGMHARSITIEAFCDPVHSSPTEISRPEI